MTTKVSVDAHAGWPILIEAIDTPEGETEGKRFMLDTVPPGGTADYHVTSTRQLLITELPREKDTQ